jgi:hypothetical protein
MKSAFAELLPLSKIMAFLCFQMCHKVRMPAGYIGGSECQCTQKNTKIVDLVKIAPYMHPL